MPALKSLSVKNLLIDIGNSSHCKLAVSDGSSILSVRRLEKAGLLSAVEKERTGGEIDVVCVSSVAQDDPALEAGLRTVCGKLVMVSAFTPMPLKVDYETGENGDRSIRLYVDDILFGEYVDSSNPVVPFGKSYGFMTENASGAVYSDIKFTEIKKGDDQS